MAKTTHIYFVCFFTGSARHVFIMAFLAVTWMLSVNMCRTKSQRAEQVYYIVLPRKAYNSSQVSRLCVAYA